MIDENQNKYSGFKERNKSLIYLIEKLQENNKKVFLIGPIETPDYKLASIVSRELAFEKNTKRNLLISRKKFDSMYKDTINLFKYKMGENFLESYKLLCDKINCYFADVNGANFSDTNHLSYYASKKMKKIFLNIFK